MMHGQERDLGWSLCILDRPSGARAAVSAPYPYDLSHDGWFPEFRLVPSPVASLRLPSLVIPAYPLRISNLSHLSHLALSLTIISHRGPFFRRTLYPQTCPSRASHSSTPVKFLLTDVSPSSSQRTVVMSRHLPIYHWIGGLNPQGPAYYPAFRALPLALHTGVHSSFHVNVFLPSPFPVKVPSTCLISEYEHFSHTCFEFAPCYAFIRSVTPYTLTLLPQLHPIPGRYPRLFPRLSAFHDPYIRYLRTSFPDSIASFPSIIRPPVHDMPFVLHVPAVHCIVTA